MIYDLIYSLFLTIIIEVMVSFLLGIKSKKDILIVILVNICTNPVLVYITNCTLLFSNLNMKIYYITVMIMEFGVIITESLLYKKYLKYKDKSPLTISLINNTISYGIGFLISNIL